MKAGPILEVHRAARKGEDADVGKSTAAASVIKGQRSHRHGGPTAVSVVGGEDQRAFATLSEAKRPTDHPRGVEGLGGVGDRPALGGPKGDLCADGVSRGARVHGDTRFHGTGGDRQGVGSPDPHGGGGIAPESEGLDRGIRAEGGAGKIAGPDRVEDHLSSGAQGKCRWGSAREVLRKIIHIGIPHRAGGPRPIGR